MKNEEEVITSSTTAPIETQLAPDAWQTHTLGDMDYEIPSSWLVNTDLSSSNTQCFYIGSGTHSSFVSAMLVVYAVETNATNGMTEELFISEIDSLNNAILDDFEDSILVQYEPHGDTMPQYADVIYEGIRNNTTITQYSRYYVDSHGVGCFFMFYVKNGLDESTVETAMSMYWEIVRSLVFEVS